MIKFNKPVRTKDGQEVVPFLMEGKKVYCFDGAKNTIIKYLSDFDFTPKMEEKKIITVMPGTVEKEPIVVVPVVEATDEFHEIKPIAEEPKIISVEPIEEPKPVEEIKIEPELEPIPEPEPKPVEEIKIEPELEPIPEPDSEPVLDNDDYFGDNDESYI